MKFFIVFSATLVCALAQIQPGGYLADAPEVAAAKLAHFEEKAKAAAAAGVAPDYVTSYYLNYYKSLNNPAAQITVLPNGYLADTPEVAAAKAAHFAEIAKATPAAQPIIYQAPTPIIPANAYRSIYYLNNPYITPAAITVLPSGFLADTPEVAAAKSAHFAEQARAAYYAA